MTKGISIKSVKATRDAEDYQRKSSKNFLANEAAGDAIRKKERPGIYAESKLVNDLRKDQTRINKADGNNDSINRRKQENL